MTEQYDDAAELAEGTVPPGLDPLLSPQAQGNSYTEGTDASSGLGTARSGIDNEYQLSKQYYDQMVTVESGDLEKCCKMSIWSQKSALIQPRTCLGKV